MARKTYRDSEATPLKVQEPVTAYELTQPAYAKKAISSDDLNPLQLHFLQMLSHIKTDEALMDLKRLIRDFYAKQLQKEADKSWTEGKIGDHLLTEHLRTPYK